MGDIVAEWGDVAAPTPPELETVTVEPAKTALLVLDMQTNNCSDKRRPRCVASLPAVADLLMRARAAGILVVYSLTRNAETSDVREEVAPLPDDPIVKSGVDKFHATDLGRTLGEYGIETVIIVGTAANGAVLHTATGAVLRGMHVVVPVDGMSASEPYAEQYTAWHLANGPGTRRAVTLTRCEFIWFA